MFIFACKFWFLGLTRTLVSFDFVFISDFCPSSFITFNNFCKSFSRSLQELCHLLIWCRSMLLVTISEYRKTSGERMSPAEHQLQWERYQTSRFPLIAAVQLIYRSSSNLKFFSVESLRLEIRTRWYVAVHQTLFCSLWNSSIHWHPLQDSVRPEPWERSLRFWCPCVVRIHTGFLLFDSQLFNLLSRIYFRTFFRWLIKAIVLKHVHSSALVVCGKEVIVLFLISPGNSLSP